MRTTREEAAQSRRRVVESAARLFRARGTAAVGIAELMQAAGMTHGGFYKHFKSKDALVAEACAFALAEGRARLRRAAEGARKGEELKAIVDSYLSEAHRKRIAKGCALAALGGEAANPGSPLHGALAEGRENFIALIAKYWTGPAARQHAAMLVSTMVGTLVTARLADPQSGAELLRAARLSLHRRLSPPKA
ncbi:MAG TPA: TetR family transcriptional regulator [Xanthobacteraceae bacterium]|nr:TetR family transcriptional regulator [Xanthobacteraceae bacterium]